VKDEPPTLFPDENALGHHEGKGEYRGMEFLHVNAKQIINEVPAASRVPFRYTINAYRGCSHACVYCFARPTHKYLDLDIGEDFDRKIVVKVNAVERLRGELRRKTWTREPIAMGTNTDPYQKAEGKYHLTKRMVETLSEARNPFSILTKSTLVLRDIELLANAAQVMPVHLNFSIGTLDRDVWKMTEPGTPPPDKRMEAVRRLNEAGIPCGVLIAPILPGLSDSPRQLRAVTRACVEAGATSVHTIGLHLRGDVKEHYLSWIRTYQPDLFPLYEQRFRNRAYQPKSEVEKLSNMIDNFLRDARRQKGAA
jgi:DNA repair photolyase